MEKKASMVKRFFAYVIDMFIISLFATIIAMPFTNTSRVTKLSDEMTTISENLQNGKIKEEEFNIESQNIIYKLYREEGVLSLARILLIVLYFVVFQIYNKGQTLGKMLLKIKVCSDNDKLSVNQMIYRCLIVDNLLLYILSFIFMLFLSKGNFYNSLVIVTFIQYLVLAISFFMGIFRKDGKGIHDVICKSHVVEV